MGVLAEFNDKRILIWGYGKEGQSTKNFLEQHFKCKKIDIYEGIQDGIDEDKFDVIFKSPGIKAEHINSRYTSQTELFLQMFADKTIGITGTKGKSTTAAMLKDSLSFCTNKKIFLVGNIGQPCLDIYDQVDENSIIVYEMSCHQLSTIDVSPHIAIFLNLYEDHLDYYGSREAYFEAKKNITIYQSHTDYLIMGNDVPDIDTKAKKIIVSDDPDEKFKLKISGDHNQYNANVVFKVCTELFDCDAVKVRQVISDFSGLPHRMEFVAKKNMVDFYNDSISTIPEATISALKSISNAKTVLIGGMDRGINYDILIQFIKKQDEFNYIFSYESGKRIYDAVGKLDYCWYKEDLETALALAQSITPKGYACILSPASASYDSFKNFEERGNFFKDLVNNIKEEE